MGTFVPAPNVAQVACFYRSFGEACENVYHVLGSSAWTVSSLNSLCNAFVTWEDTNASHQRHSAVALQSIEATDLTTQNGLQTFFSTGLPIDGLNAGGLPNNVTVAIKHNTGLRGRSFRGRTFWIGLYASVVSGDAISDAMINALIANMNALNSLISGVNGGQHVVLSRKHNGADRAVAVATPVTAYTVNAVCDSQRRRLPDHNRHG